MSTTHIGTGEAPAAHEPDDDGDRAGVNALIDGAEQHLREIAEDTIPAPAEDLARDKMETAEEDKTASNEAVIVTAGTTATAAAVQPFPFLQLERPQQRRHGREQTSTNGEVVDQGRRTVLKVLSWGGVALALGGSAATIALLKSTGPSEKGSPDTTNSIGTGVGVGNASPSAEATASALRPNVPAGNGPKPGNLDPTKLHPTLSGDIRLGPDLKVNPPLLTNPFAEGGSPTLLMAQLLENIAALISLEPHNPEWIAVLGNISDADANNQNDPLVKWILAQNQAFQNAYAGGGQWTNQNIINDTAASPMQATKPVYVGVNLAFGLAGGPVYSSAASIDTVCNNAVCAVNPNAPATAKLEWQDARAFAGPQDSAGNATSTIPSDFQATFQMVPDPAHPNAPSYQIPRFVSFSGGEIAY